VSAHQTFSFRREPQAARAARAALGALDGQFPSARLYDASLCVSELVSNAIQHPAPGEGLELTLDLGEDRLRVEVVDPGSGFVPGRPTEGDERGWGLFIVDSLADEWGVEAGDRTTVWFEIMRAPRDQLGQETTWKAGTSAPST
jgi:anti-sigma regulatory factor (Ser/Thr protein kinase)